MDFHNDGRMHFDIGSPERSHSPVLEAEITPIDDAKVAPSDTSAISQMDSPRRRFGDLSGIIMDQPVAQVAADVAASANANCKRSELFVFEPVHQR